VDQPTNGSRFHRHFIVAAVLFSALFFILLGFWPPEGTVRKGERATESLRRHHREGRERLAQIASLLEAIPEGSPATRTELAWIVIASLKEDLRAHDAWEEQVHYPAVDKEVRTVSDLYTAPLRQEHRIIDRWIGELEKMAGDPLFDPRAFCARGDRLLGLLEAHFEVEENVVLPILDRAKTPARAPRDAAPGMIPH
jgi:iron-sulfur cluster repair protein YtfE (RIC family)